MREALFCRRGVTEALRKASDGMQGQLTPSVIVLKANSRSQGSDVGPVYKIVVTRRNKHLTIFKWYWMST